MKHKHKFIDKKLLVSYDDGTDRNKFLFVKKEIIISEKDLPWLMKNFQSLGGLIRNVKIEKIKNTNSNSY